MTRYRQYRLLIRCIVLLTGVWWADKAAAEPIAFNVQGIVQSVGDPSLGVRGGDVFSGYYLFDSATVDQAASDSHGVYRQTSPGRFYFSAGRYEVSGTDYMISVTLELLNGIANSGWYDVTTTSGVGFSVDRASLGTDALPLAPPSTWLNAYFYGPGWGFAGDIQSISLVPEPGSLLSLGAGLGCAALVRWRGRRTASSRSRML